VASPSGFGSTHPPVGNPFRLQADGDYPPATRLGLRILPYCQVFTSA